MTAIREMRVFEVGGDGRPVTVASRPVPTPAGGQVLVRVAAVALNARDRPIVEGRYSMPVPAGRIPLSDGAGVVAAVGDGVTRFRIGDRVMSLFHPNWLYGPPPGWGELYGVQLDGWLTEYRALSEQSLVAVPEHLTLAEAATLPCAAVTAWNALAGVGSGDTVLVQGTGGVSVFALQFARLAGARVLATTSSADKAARLRELGAADVVDYTAIPRWGTRVRELTDGRGVDLVVDVGGAGTLAESLDALADGGTVTVVGSLADGAGLDPRRLLGRGATVRAVLVGSRADVDRMNRAITRHRLHPVVDRVFPFAEAAAAFDHFARGSRLGKVVIAHEG